MDYLVIEGVKPYDGRYELDLEGQEFTTREWGFIKRFSSYLPLTASEGFAANDPELVCAIAVILLRRAGRIDTPEVPAVFDRLADAPYLASLRWEFDPDTVEGDADDPTESSNGSTSISGPGSTPSSETSLEHPNRSGTPASATSTSVPATSVS